MDADVDMGLCKKTTILFTHDLYESLTAIAKQRRSSVGQLVRDACRAQYSISTRTERTALVHELASLRLPVGTPEEMERESVAGVELLP